MRCDACGLVRELADLLAYWPVGKPELRRYVCRVTRPSPIAAESCFRVAVGPVGVHEIGAIDGPYATGGPIRPGGRFRVGERGEEWFLPVASR